MNLSSRTTLKAHRTLTDFYLPPSQMDFSVYLLREEGEGNEDK